MNGDSRGQRSRSESPTVSRPGDDGSDTRSPSVAPRLREDLAREVEALRRENEELRNANTRLSDSLRLIESVIESLPHPFYVVEPSTYRVVMANSAARIGPLGNGATCHALSHGSPEPCRSGEHKCPVSEVVRTKAPVVVEHVHVGPDGAPLDVEVHAFPIFDDRGDVSKVIEYAMDVSRRKRAEEERELHVRELERAVAKVRLLTGLLPICSSCKKIRDDKGYWSQIEVYIREHSEADFSHSYCPDCAEDAVRELRERSSR